LFVRIPPILTNIYNCSTRNLRVFSLPNQGTGSSVHASADRGKLRRGQQVAQHDGATHWQRYSRAAAQRLVVRPERREIGDPAKAKD